MLQTARQIGQTRPNEHQNKRQRGGHLETTPNEGFVDGNSRVDEVLMECDKISYNFDV